MRVEEKWSWEWSSSAGHGQCLGRDFGPASPLLSTSFLNSGFGDISHYLLSTDFVPGTVLGTQYIVFLNPNNPERQMSLSCFTEVKTEP